MPIDYPRLVDGLDAATRMVASGADPLTVADTLLPAVQAATGALGATLIEFGAQGGRVLSGCGAMAWATGRAGSTVPERGRLACAGSEIRAGGPAYGSVNLFFDRIDPAAGPTLEPALRLVAAVLAGAYASSPLAEARPARPAALAGPEEDDRTLFLAVAGHELRTPVTVVKGYATMLAERWESLDETARRAAVQVLAQRADEMARLVDRMLGASVGVGAEAGGLIRTVTFEAIEVLRQAVLDLPAEHRAAVRLDLPASLPAVRGDPAMLPPIVAELVANALRHSGPAAAAPPGPDSRVVEIQAGVDAQTVYFRVSDRGLGIDPAHVERAFERFWRASRDNDPRNGAGLGLYLVRRLVERQHGWVSLRPRDGGGTVAEVRLPRADARSIPTQPTSALRERLGPVGA